MLIEIWEKIRGYDKWLSAAATIKSSTIDREVAGHDRRTDEAFYVWRGNEEIAWIDCAGIMQCEPLAVDETSPLFKMYDGRKVNIRYNPTCPSEFYVREQLSFLVNRATKITLIFVGSVAAVIALILFLLRD